MSSTRRCGSRSTCRTTPRAASRRAAKKCRAQGGRASISVRARSSGNFPKAAPISAPRRAAATAPPLVSNGVASRVTIDGGSFRINGTPTYPGRSWKGHRIEGRLFNSRMANAIADDENPATRGGWSYADGDWDAERSTREFIAALPDYRAQGLLAVCINISGGSPQGYSWNQPWKICGFTAGGTIKPAWAARLGSVIEACDRL